MGHYCLAMFVPGPAQESVEVLAVQFGTAFGA